MRQKKITLSGTFVVDPMLDDLLFWLKYIDANFRLTLVTYGQLFKQLTMVENPINSETDLTIIMIRLDDWFRSDVQDPIKNLSKNVNLFKQLLISHINHVKQNYLICLCPGNYNYITQEIEKKFHGILKRTFSKIESTVVVDITSILAELDLPISSFINQHTEEIGHIPYKKTFYNALGFFICRAIYTKWYNKFKVIVVDCDNTLWDGVCGELGWQGVTIDSNHLKLQETLIKQYEIGVLICLCSKNVPEDVWEVFDKHSNMLLKRKHIAASRINWETKSQNIVDLANILNLGLDCFIFIDDNPVEIAEVHASFPEVLGILLPKPSEDWSRYFSLSWLYNHSEAVKITKEDQLRTKYYQQEIQRTELLKQSTSNYSGFLAKMDLKVEIRSMTKEDLSRAAQLTNRTNQFNMAKHEYEISSLRDVLNVKDSYKQIVQVSDRFGDYGITGIIFYQHNIIKNVCLVTDFLLSCRVLGRGVEHRIVAWLANHVQENKIDNIAIYFCKTNRNEPAQNFLLQLKPEKIESYQDGELYYFKTNFLLNVTFNPNENTLLQTQVVKSKNIAKTKNKRGSRNNIEAIETKIIQNKIILFEDDKFQNRPVKEIVRYNFQQVLKRKAVKDKDSFWSLGGNSLDAVLLLGLIFEELGQKLPVKILDKYDTVEKLTNYLLNNSEQTSLVEFPKIKHVNSKLADMELSYQQEPVWAAVHTTNSPQTFNVCLAFELRGKLDRTKLKLALNHLLITHQNLRLNFNFKANKILQYLENYKQVPFSLSVIKTKNKAKQTDVVNQWLNNLSEKIFDLNKEVLFNASLLKLEKDKHVLGLCFHHLIIDEWSLDKICHDISDFYNLDIHKKLLKDKVKATFLNYVAWQRDVSQENYWVMQEKFWENKIKDVNALELPYKHGFNLSLNENNLAEHTTLKLSKSLYNKLINYIKKEKLTMYGVLLSAILIVLKRYGNKKPFIGVPFANRNHPQFTSTAGLFTQVWPFGSLISDNATFYEVCLQVKDQLLEMSNNSECSFTRVLKNLSLTPEMALDKLLFISFAFYTHAKNMLNFNGINIKKLPYESNHILSRLQLTVRETEETLLLTGSYQQHLFDSISIKRLLNHVFQVLDQGIVQPKIPASQLTLLTLNEYEILKKWSKQENNFVGHKAILNLFSKVVNFHPSRLAVISENEKLTYSELDQKSTELAKELLKYTSQKPKVIAIMLPRTSKAIISMLAILKANSTYLPIDLALPDNRIAFMLENANAELCICLERECLRLRSFKGIIYKIDASNSITSHSNIIIKPRTNKLVYVMYTSGSTGKPKAVQIEEQGIIQLVKNCKYVNFQPLDNITQISSLSFDASVLEIWGGLLNGLGLVIINSSSLLNLQVLRKEIVAHRVNIMVLSTAYFHQVAAEMPRLFSGIKHLIIGGEQLYSSSVKFVLDNRRYRPKFIYNAYGPTEATNMSTINRIREPIFDPIPIGVPTSGKIVYILDRQKNPVPIGIWGELYLGGAGISPGYLNAASDQQQKFINLKVKDLINKPMYLYKTGDKVRFLPNGLIVFGGRFDRQIKRRGYRIELDEVEQIAMNLKNVKQATVMVTLNQDELSIDLYIKSKLDNDAEFSDNIQEQLEEWLPAYMLPDRIFFVNHLPINTQGKLDMNQINENDSINHIRNTHNVEKRKPIDAIDYSLRTIWADLLGKFPEDVEKDFFSSGGDSLKFTILLARVQTQLRVLLPVKKLLKKVNISTLIAAVEEAMKLDEHLPKCILPIKTTGSKKLFMAHPSSGSPLVYHSLAKYMKDTQIYGLTSPLLFDASLKQYDSIEEVASYYVSAILRTQHTGSYHLAGWSMGGLIALEIAQQLLKQNKKVNSLTLVDTYHPSLASKLLIENHQFNIANKIEEVHVQIAMKYRPKLYSGKIVLMKAVGKTENSIDNKLLSKLGWPEKKYPNIMVYPINGIHQLLFEPPTVKKIAECLQKLIK